LRRTQEVEKYEDNYCLNINFEKTDEEGVSPDYVYYDSVFSSKLSEEAQKTLVLDDYFRIENTNILGSDNELVPFEGEIFGFQVVFDDIGETVIDYSFVLPDPFFLKNGEYVPNPNRGKVILLQKKGNLFDENEEHTNLYYEKYNYYANNFNNAIIYYGIEEGAVT
jgi:hypothetical protein